MVSQTSNKKVFKCPVCGNITEILRDGGGDLVCCGETMERMIENASKDDTIREKHIPVITLENKLVTVKIGASEHPMDDKHFIEWIDIIKDDEVYRHFLEPGQEPRVSIPSELENIIARAYCNIHGLWSATL